MKMPRKTISSPEEIQPAFQWAYQLIVKGLAAGDVDLVLERPSRSGSQNDKFHPMIRDIARHINHPILGRNEHQWRYFLLALFQDQLMVPSLDGQKFVFVPTKGSSELTVPEASDFIEFLYSTGAEEGVSWSEPSLQAYEQYRQKQ